MANKYVENNPFRLRTDGGTPVVPPPVKKRGRPKVPDPIIHDEDEEEEEIGWECSDCNKDFATEDELDDHICGPKPKRRSKKAKNSKKGDK